MTDPWDKAMGTLSDLELDLIMVGAKKGTLKAVGEGGGYYAGLKAAMERVRRAQLVPVNQDN